MTGRAIGWALGLCLALPVFAAGQSAAQREEWNRPVAPFRVIGDIYYVGAEGVSAYLFKTNDGLILLDGGLRETPPRILESIAALGFDIRDVKVLLNSHAHHDHGGGLAELKRRSGATLAASAADAPALTAGSVDMPPVTVDRVLADGDTVTLGGTTLTAVATPGHTKGCTSWTATATEAGRAYSVFIHCSTSVVDTLVGNAGYPNIVADYERTFARLRDTKADVFLAGHPFMFDMAAKRARIAAGAPNPFVDADELQRYNATSERQFRAALAKERD